MTTVSNDEDPFGVARIVGLKTKRTVGDVYEEAEAEGLYGFDVDMKLTPEQNLDMARAGFTTMWDDNNQWDVK